MYHEGVLRAIEEKKKDKEARASLFQKTPNDDYEITIDVDNINFIKRGGEEFQDTIKNLNIDQPMIEHKAHVARNIDAWELKHTNNLVPKLKLKKRRNASKT